MSKLYTVTLMCVCVCVCGVLFVHHVYVQCLGGHLIALAPNVVIPPSTLSVCLCVCHGPALY